MLFHFHQRNVNSFTLKLAINSESIERVTFWPSNWWSSQLDPTYPKDLKQNILYHRNYVLPEKISAGSYFEAYVHVSYGFRIGRIEKLQKRAIRTIANGKYNAHTDPLFRRFNLLKGKDIFMLNILKMYYKLQKKLLPPFTTNMFSVATCACNYNLRVTESLSDANTKTIGGEKCIRSYLPKVINETDDDVMDEIATHSYQGFAFYFKRITIIIYSLSCDKRNCYECYLRSNWKLFFTLFLYSPFPSYVQLFCFFIPTSNIQAVFFMCTAIFYFWCFPQL